MEYGSIEREIHVDASPEVVFEVISSPVHLKEWWPDEAELDRATPGGVGQLVFGEPGSPDALAEQFTVVDADPPRLFSIRWLYPEGAAPGPGNSLLITFELVPTSGGTTVRLTETGFRERGWEAAVLEEAYRDHVTGWDTFVPRLGEYVKRLAANR
ncbi:uncharacterized protein YndB with AHSA1/START domain [Kribbella amoyensis]|uniref:Uncharacterized protein YndB with AHSA1/START domain n=1 Tax=Kribbella amoyensis TaxID=996641 RepID=A0A561BZS8_9ACTN|nr:SRPBCC domain-containing protein [Kribbella amoyensis]TWD84182.1 uncharacterized protein YndB with AHSA1/START domain [Kribbella amoyensis]